MKHLFGTASAAGVALGLALFASSAYAQTTQAGDDATSRARDSYNTNSQNTTVPVTDSFKNQSTNNSNNSTPLTDVNNDKSNSYNTSSLSVPLTDVANDKSDHDNNKDNGNDNSQGSHNDSSMNFDQSQHNDNSQHFDQSQHNDSSSRLTIGDVSLALSSTDLDGSVSGQSFNGGGGFGGGGGVYSGALSFSGNAMQGYAGITNANYVTGQGSLGQAANSVTATSSVSFR